MITRNHYGPIDTSLLTSQKWYLLQTNQDHFDGICPERCTEGRKLLDTLGQANFNVTSAFTSVLDQAPLLNAASTYTALMIPETGHFQAFQANGTYPVSDL